MRSHQPRPRFSYRLGPHSRPMRGGRNGPQGCCHSQDPHLPSKQTSVQKRYFHCVCAFVLFSSAVWGSFWRTYAYGRGLGAYFGGNWVAWVAWAPCMGPARTVWAPCMGPARTVWAPCRGPAWLFWPVGTSLESPQEPRVRRRSDQARLWIGWSPPGTGTVPKGGLPRPVVPPPLGSQGLWFPPWGAN